MREKKITNSHTNKKTEPKIANAHDEKNDGSFVTKKPSNRDRQKVKSRHCGRLGLFAASARIICAMVYTTCEC